MRSERAASAGEGSAEPGESELARLAMEMEESGFLKVGESVSFEGRADEYSEVGKFEAVEVPSLSLDDCETATAEDLEERAKSVFTDSPAAEGLR